jgi:superfamily II DNA helicase RecQ
VATALLRARTINSANLHEWEDIQAEVAAGEVDVLLISPERLNNPEFRDEVLPKLASTVGLLVVDEAHSVSDRRSTGPGYSPLYISLASCKPSAPLRHRSLVVTVVAVAVDRRRPGQRPWPPDAADACREVSQPMTHVAGPRAHRA